MKMNPLYALYALVCVYLLVTSQPVWAYKNIVNKSAETNLNQCEALFQTSQLQKLIKAQSATQSDKEIARSLDEYTYYIFQPEYQKHSPYFTQNIIHKFLNQIIFTNKISYTQNRLANLLKALAASFKRKIIWTDLGGGIALAQRQLLRRSKSLAEIVEFLNIDLFDWKQVQEREKYLKSISTYLREDIFDLKYQPQLYRQDIANFHLDQKSDFITSIESIQYIDDKLKLLVHAYNQLSDNGIMIISTEHAWTRDMRYSEDDSYDKLPDVFHDFVTSLKKEGIEVLYTKANDLDRDYTANAILIRKTPNTKLVLNAKLQNTESNKYGYIFSYYSKSEASLLISVKPQ